MNLPILLTASVSTHGMKGALFSDNERETMYLATLEFYLNMLPENRQLVFAENSGWNLHNFKTKLIGHVGKNATRIEYISINPSICDQNRGKGYNEILMINEAIVNSKAIQNAGAFLKVTGRYPIYNLVYFLTAAEAYFNKGGKYYGDIKDHHVYDILFFNSQKKWNGHAAYTVLFAVTLDFYRQYFHDSYQHCNDYTNNWIENVWFSILKPFREKKDYSVSLRFSREPICGGLQGSSVQTFVFSQSNNSIKARILRFIGNSFRLLTPWFWF